MLIRLVSHPEGNSDHIDKMIYIEGLPDKMFYHFIDGKKYLNQPPWRVDEDERVPEGIRRVFFKHPTTVWFQLPKDPTFPGQKDTEYSLEANCLVIDYQTAQGEQLWKQIEALLDRETPRDQDIPEPAVVGDKLNWTLEAADVPSVVLEKREPKTSNLILPTDLTPGPVPQAPAPQPVPAPVDKVPEGVQFKTVEPTAGTCPECKKEGFTEVGLKQHMTKLHSKEFSRN
jgi:hypothetical protein